MNWTTRLYIYTFCIYFTASSYTMIVPFLPLYLLELGATSQNVTFWGAIVFAISFLIGGTMAPVWGKLSDIKGKKSMAVRSSIMLTIAYSSGAIVTSPLQLFFMRVMQGFANGYLPTVLSIVASIAPPKKIGMALGYIQAANLAGTVSGPLIGGILASVFSLRLTFVIAGAFLTFVSIINIFMPKDENEVHAPSHASSIFADIKFSLKTTKICELLVITFAYSMLIIAIQSILPLFIEGLEGHDGKVALYSGIICSAPPLIGAFLAPLWGLLGQSKGFLLALALTAIGSGFFLFLQGFSNTVITLLVLSCAMGLFLFGVNPSVNAALSEATDIAFRGRGFGVLTMAGQYGSMLGPMVATAVTYVFDLSSIFYLSGLGFISIGIYALIRHKERFLKRRIQ